MLIYREWSKADERLLTDMWRQGQTYRHLAEHFGVSLASIRNKVRRLGLSLSGEQLHQRLRMSPGRPPVWPDCPPHLRGEYRRLRKAKGYTAIEAREVLEQAA